MIAPRFIVKGRETIFCYSSEHALNSVGRSSRAIIQQFITKKNCKAACFRFTATKNTVTSAGSCTIHESVFEGSNKDFANSLETVCKNEKERWQRDKDQLVKERNKANALLKPQALLRKNSSKKPPMAAQPKTLDIIATKQEAAANEDQPAKLSPKKIKRLKPTDGLGRPLKKNDECPDLKFYYQLLVE
jgi:hypothetical protein